MGIGRGSLGTRLLAALFSLTFLVIQGGLEPRHVCPLHDASPNPAPIQAEQHGHHAPTEASDDGESCCTCIGSCMAGGLIAAPAAPIAVTWVQTDHDARSRIVRAGARINPLPRLLPFATAPPLS